MSLFQQLKKTGRTGERAGTVRPAPGDAPLVRRRFCFLGRVQGVGFRYEAQRIAVNLELVGWVRNREDGGVTAEAEGPANRVEAFLMSLEAVPRFDITEIRREELPPLGTERTFRIVY